MAESNDTLNKRIAKLCRAFGKTCGDGRHTGLQIWDLLETWGEPPDYLNTYTRSWLCTTCGAHGEGDLPGEAPASDATANPGT